MSRVDLVEMSKEIAVVSPTPDWDSLHHLGQMAVGHETHHAQPRIAAIPLDLGNADVVRFSCDSVISGGVVKRGTHWQGLP